MRQTKDALNDPSASLAENSKANILQNMLKTTELHHMRNEVDARAESNTEVMRKIAMVGAVTPASVLAEAIASLTSPWQETVCELNTPSPWCRISLTNDKTSTDTYLIIQKLFQCRAAGRNKYVPCYSCSRGCSPISRNEGV